MKKTFDMIKDSYKGRKAVVIGHGASADTYLSNKEFLKDKVIIGCNLWFRHYNIIPNFWVFANPDLNMKTMSETINYFYKDTNNVVVYCDTIDLTNKQIVDESFQNVNYLPYDHIHFNKTKCVCEPCCIHLDVQRNTIQEELCLYTNYNYRYSTGNTGLLHAMAISIIIGCVDIEVIGFDRNYRSGYCKDLSSYPTFDLAPFLFDVPPPYSFDGLTERINVDFNVIKNSANNINRKITIL